MASWHTRQALRMKVVNRWGRPGTLTRVQLNPSWYAFTTLRTHSGVRRPRESRHFPPCGGRAVPRVASVSLSVLISRAVDQDRVRIQAIALHERLGTLRMRVLKQAGEEASSRTT